MCLSKVFEKVMYARIITFLENFKLLNEKQFGFRKKIYLYDIDNTGGKVT